MSTYLIPGKPFRIDTLPAPTYVKDYLNYLLVVRNLAPRTVNDYFVALRSFLRWVVVRNTNLQFTPDSFQDVPIKGLPMDALGELTESDLYEYLSFSSGVLNNQAITRGLKLTVVKSFYDYYTRTKPIFKENPAAKIPSPKLEKRLPKYLSFEECMVLLSSIDGSQKERDYCMITFLVNCGMRLSELVGINVNDIRPDNSMVLFGKGRKERVVYLNAACVAALQDYLLVRRTIRNADEEPALFLSDRTGKRLSGRRVQQILEKALLKCGLSGRGFSPHKLRHTAATLLYQSGNADVLTLKAILGHENIATTEIYTHMDQKQVREAMAESPLAKVRKQ